MDSEVLKKLLFVDAAKSNPEFQIGIRILTQISFSKKKLQK
jgi:hypothetical protein